MTQCERRWQKAVLGAFTPRAPRGLLRRADDVDHVGAFRRVRAASNWRAALGLRLALLLVALAPVWLLGRPQTFASLPEDEQAPLLERLLGHRSFVVRELTLLLKFVAMLALFSDRTARAASHYDDESIGEDIAESGERLKLPGVTEERIDEEVA